MSQKSQAPEGAGDPNVKRGGRLSEEITPSAYQTILNHLRPHLADWQHPAGLARKTYFQHRHITAVLRMAVEEGLVEMARSNPVSYRLVDAAQNLPDPESIEVPADAPTADSLRWLQVNLQIAATMDELRSRTRVAPEVIAEHIAVGVASGHVRRLPDGPRYVMETQAIELFSRGAEQVEALKARLWESMGEEDVTPPMLVERMGVTRERVRQILERAIDRGIVVQVKTRPQTYRFVQESDRARPNDPDAIMARPVSELPATTRALNVLQANGITTVGDLVASSKQHVATLPGMGKRSLDELVIVLGEMGLEMGAEAA